MRNLVLNAKRNLKLPENAKDGKPQRPLVGQMLVFTFPLSKKCLEELERQVNCTEAAIKTVSPSY